jgi:O-glycosyl hydrolase
MFPSKLIARFAVVVLLLTASQGWAQTTQPVSINVNQGTRFQKIEGLGTALASDSHVWNSQFLQMYTQDLGASILRVALTPDILPNQVTLGPDVQSNISLFNFMGNYPQTNWGQFAQQATAATNGQLKVIASVWSPPAWMKTTNSWNGGSLIQTPANLTQFARYMAAYVKGFQQSYGVPLYAVSIQNELRFWEPYPSTVYGYSDYVNALNAVGAEFARDGITTKIMGPEDVGVDGGWITQQTMGYINAAKANGTAYTYLGFYAIHGYSGNGASPGSSEANWASYYQQIAADGKESWMTETSGENPVWVHFDSNGNPDGALSVALNMHETLAYGNANAYVYWQMDDGDHSTTTTTTLTANVDPTSLKYNAAKHYIKFIRPGAVRVAASPDNISGISVDAYVEPDNTMTIELINPSAYDTPTTITIPGTNYSSFAEYLTTATQPWAVLPDLSVTPSNSLSLTIPANSVITLQSDGFVLVLPEPASLALALPALFLTLRRRRA